MTFEQGFFVGFVVCQFVFAGIAWKAGVLEALMEYIDEGKKSRRSEVRRVAAQIFAAMHPIDPANASRAAQTAIQDASVLVDFLDQLQSPHHEPPGKEEL